MCIEDLKDWTEIAANVAQVATVLAGLWALRVWQVSRRDRAADTLLQLEEQFQKTELKDARGLLEDDDLYRELIATLDAVRENKPLPKVNGADHADDLEKIDALLRFYVLLFQFRRNRQAPDDALRACYAYWLNFYNRPSRQAFQLYMKKFFPSLSKWIETDKELPEDHRFFRMKWAE